MSEKHSELTLTPAAEMTLRFINQTNQSVFLTGKAGTGKTTLLKQIIRTTHKNAVIVAPTGIAALNAGGVTIHSFFQLPFGGFIPEFGVSAQFTDYMKMETKESLMRHFKLSKQRRNMMRNLELLIIDEVSMLRADLLDAMDWSLRNVRKNNAPFGGVQVLFIGDLMQLPPVVKQDEWFILQRYYSGIFFFHAHVLQESQPLYIELEKIHRQSDIEFIDILNNLRENRITSEDLARLNSHVQKDFDASKSEGYITLTTHNAKADRLNQSALQELKSKPITYKAEITGEFPQHLYPLEPELVLKEGAQVMFIKNDPTSDKRFYNGKMGTITTIHPNEIKVTFTEEKNTISVEKYEWENVKYTFNENTREIEEETVGTFVHYPIKLAWAITVHKSQGLTFKKAVLDVAEVFAPGQAYVALSRLQSLDGLVMLSPMQLNGLENDQQVVDYASSKPGQEILNAYLEHGTKKYLLDVMMEAFDWHEMYTQWAIHESTYAKVSVKSEKAKNAAWIALQVQRLNGTLDPAKKFQGQLQNIFSRPNLSYEFLFERVNAAYGYFFKTLDEVLSANLKQIALLGRVKKTKQYAEELVDLDEILTETIIKLKKVHVLSESLANGREINKEIFKQESIQNYKLAKMASVDQELRSKPVISMFDQPEEERLELLVQRKKDLEKPVVKLSTYDRTLELFTNGYSLEQIAQKRQLTSQTVAGHFVNLIKKEKIDIEDLIGEERLAELAVMIPQDYEGPMSALIEKYPDNLSWEELKLYMASKQL